MVQQEVGYRISDSPSDNPTIKKSDNPLPVRALLDYYVPTYLDLLVGFSAHIYYTDWIALLKSIDLDSKDSDGQVREYD